MFETESISRPIRNNPPQNLLDCGTCQNTFLREIIDNTLAEVCVFSADTLRFVYCNYSLRQNTGYSLEELKNYTPCDLTHFPEDKFRLLLDQLRLGSKDTITIEVNRFRKNGTSYPAEVRLWYCSTTEPPVFVGNAIDISEKKRAQDELKKSNVLLEKRVRIKTAALSKSNDALKATVSKLKVKEEALIRSKNELRNLSTKLQGLIEEERARIAREIHDELGQAMTAMKLDLAHIKKRIPTNRRELIEKIDSTSSLVDQTIKSVRRISSDLRPPHLDDLGLAAALEWLTQEFYNRTGIRCSLKVQMRNPVRNADLATAIFRISQEALTNCARHAQAKSVSITLTASKSLLKLVIRDQGVGISKAKTESPKSLGLIGMRERSRLWGGKLHITGKPGMGTAVTVTIPRS